MKEKIGSSYGSLTIVRQCENINGAIAYECLCDCGRTRKVIGSYLRNGRITSCGHERPFRLENEYDLSGEYGICYMGNRRAFFLFDIEDYEKIKDYHWFVSHYGYAYCSKNNKSYKAHRIIMDCPDGLEVDHINHDTLDNRKSNLRICSHGNNMKNMPKRNSQSGITGVTHNKKYGYWIARIGLNKTTKHLGCFKNKEDAISARKQAEIEYFGEFANTERS